MGAFATQILANEADLQPVPKGWSYLEASSWFYTALTAYAALIFEGEGAEG